MIILKIELSLLIISSFLALFSWMASKGADPVQNRLLTVRCRNAAATFILSSLVLLMLVLVTCAWVLF